jgi:hypothetical protein
MKPMFPFSERELARRAAKSAAVEPGRRREWVRRRFFRTQSRPMSRREVALKVSNARLWLEVILHAGPLPSREV